MFKNNIECAGYFKDDDSVSKSKVVYDLDNMYIDVSKIPMYVQDIFYYTDNGSKNKLTFKMLFTLENENYNIKLNDECTLSICKVCGGSEGFLTTECSGENSYQKDEDVYSGKLDFRYGKWREGICTRVMLWLPDKAIPNEIKYLQELLSENAPHNILEEECKYIFQWIDVEKGRIKC